MVSIKKSDAYDYFFEGYPVYIYLEFYDFNLEKQNIWCYPQRINLLSQLLRPQWVKEVHEYDCSDPFILIATSFSGDQLTITLNKNSLIIFQLNSDWTIKGKNQFQIKDAQIESILMSQSNLIVKSNGLYYEFDYQIYKGLDEPQQIQQLNLAKDFRPTNLKNIIQSGIYDILIYENNVKIFNNINPLNELMELVLSNDILNLLQSQKFIQLDDHSIACLRLPVYMGGNINIIDISNQNLVKRDRDLDIQLESPWPKEDIKNCKFDLLKYKQQQYAAFIVTSPNQKGSFYQYYRFHFQKMRYTLAFRKPQKDHITLQQIPHIPYATTDGHLFINCEMYHSTSHDKGNLLMLNLLQDECEILNQDQLSIQSQDLEVYETSFKKSLFTFIEAKENLLDKVIQSDKNFYLIEIPELKTFFNIRQDAISSEMLIFSPSLMSIKHLTLKQPMHYLTHKVIYRDSSYYVSIILSTKDNALYEVWMSFYLSGVTQAPLNFITKLKESHNLNQSHLSDDLTLSLLIYDNEDLNHASVCCYRKYSQNLSGDLWSDQAEIFQFDITNQQIQATAQQVSRIIQRLAQRQTLRIEGSFLKEFVSIIKKYSQIEVYHSTYVFAILNQIMLFSSEGDYLKILDDQLSLISTVSLKLMAPLLSIASLQDSGMLEYIDQFNNKYAFPTICNSQDSDQQNQLLNRYSKDFRYPRPFFFGLHDGLITHLDLNKNKLFFYKSEQDEKDLNAYARIEIIAQKSSFIDNIFGTKERIQIEHEINTIDINLLFSYNINKRGNLITGTKNHSEKDHIYGILYKKLEITEIKELPMLIYNTSLVSNKYETILDVLIDNKAIKLAQLIVSICIKQDPLGYFYNRLGPYLSLFSANELQMFLDSHIFFFQIPTDCYEEYQIQDDTFITPISDYQNFAEVKKNMRDIEKKMLQIEEVKVEECKDHEQPVERKEEDKLQISERFAMQKKQPVPIEYFAINLMQLIKSKQIPIKENHRQVTQMLNQLVEKDATILERESIQIIIDFKWNSYAWKFFSVQLFLFVCFIIAFIFDILGVSNNSHVFSSKDSSQIIPRIISIAIMIPFAIYEIANIKADIKRKFTTFWNVNDLLLIFIYATYFPITFSKPDQDYLLKALQLLIVIFSFIKFTFLIRIWTQVSFLVRMLIVVFKELLIFLLFFLLVLGGLTVMAQIIIKESGDGYAGIKTAAFFVIVLRQAIGDYDTSSIIEGTRDFKILAWLFWLLILIIGNIVFMNFIIAVVSESYESCMEQKVQLVYKAKLEMIEECEALMPEWLFTHREWFPRFLIVRRQQGSSSGAGGDNPDEWQGFVKQIKRQLKQETAMLNDIFTQNIKRSSDQTKKALDEVRNDMKTGLDEVRNDMKAGLEEVKKVNTEEVKVLRDQMNEFKEILFAVYKDKLPAINAK